MSNKTNFGDALNELIEFLDKIGAAVEGPEVGNRPSVEEIQEQFWEDSVDLSTMSRLFWAAIDERHSDARQDALVLKFPPGNQSGVRSDEELPVMRMAAKTGQSRPTHAPDTLLPYGDIWVDGHRCTLLASNGGKRVFVRGSIREEAETILLGDEPWRLRFRTEDSVFEVVGMTKPRMDELSDHHCSQATSARTV